jgi:hypothetical protein
MMALRRFFLSTAAATAALVAPPGILLLLPAIAVAVAVSLPFDDEALLDAVLSGFSCEEDSCCRPAAARRDGMAVLERSKCVSTFFKTSFDASTAAPEEVGEEEERCVAVSQTPE